MYYNIIGDKKVLKQIGLNNLIIITIFAFCNKNKMTRNLKRNIVIIASSIVLLLLVGFVYKTFFRPNYTSSGNIAGILIFGLILGIIITYLFLQLRSARKAEASIKTSSHTVIESIKRVFKIVVAEGQMNEIFNYENTKKLLKVIPSTKKALVIVKAKVMIGYDINNCRWEVDEDKKVIRLIEFPKPEILSLETDFNYYYFEDDLFNFIGRKDLQEIQYLAKDQVKKSALQSDLLKIASNQMKLLLGEVVSLNNWSIENVNLIDDYAYPIESEQEIEQSKEPSILSKINLVEKAVNLLKLRPGN